MKCPNCNSEIKDGFLLCSNCGKELSYVPTFDAEIEVKMDSALSDVNIQMQDTVDLSGHPEIAYTKDLSKSVDKDAYTKDLSQIADASKLYDKLGKTKKKKILLSRKILLIIALVIVLCIVASLFIRKQYINNTYDSLIKRATECVDNGEYEKALPLFNAAVQKNEATAEAKYGLANAYFMLADYQNSKDVLNELILEEPSFRDAYALLITIYESESDYDNISSLLAACQDASVYDEFRQYVAPAPGFSMDEGDYEAGMSLSLLTDTKGTIYYSLDGSEPDENSMEYTEPILLEEGKCVIRAVFINEYGIKSESVSKIYNIASKVVNLPQILTEGGEYERPEYIVLNADENNTIYYTIDGSMPDKNSNEYIYPIPMRSGENVYKFILVDESDNVSDVVAEKYDLKVQANFSESEALNYLVNNFTAQGKLADVSGVAANLSGMYLYKCIGVIEYNGKIAYLIEEFYKGLDSDKYNSTEIYYGVDVNDATIYSTVRDSDGKFKFE